MFREFASRSEADTRAAAAELAEELFARRPAFVQLSGPLGAGKSTFARGFITTWAKLAGDALPDTLVSPTYNIAKTYGAKVPVVHLDLYRLKNFAELEHLGFEQYFYEMPCCLVEWLEQLPEAVSARPEHAVIVELEFAGEGRLIRIRGQ